MFNMVSVGYNSRGTTSYENETFILGVTHPYDGVGHESDGVCGWYNI